MVQGELSFPNPRTERVRWEANTKPQHTEKGIVKEGYLQNSKWKFQMFAEGMGQ